MTNITNKIIAGIILLTVGTSLNACGNTEMPVMVPDVQQTMASAVDDMQYISQKQLLVKFKSDTLIKDFHSKYGTKTIKVIPIINVHVIEVMVGIRASQLVGYLKNDSSVKYAEVNNVLNFSPDSVVNPVYSIQSADYKEMIGQKADIRGTYRSSRSGAVIYTQNSKLSLVDIDGTVLAKLPNMTEGASVSVSGLIKQVNGFNISGNIGIMPVSVKKI